MKSFMANGKGFLGLKRCARVWEGVIDALARRVANWAEAPRASA